ncbi:uncharacterized protein LOC121860457 [Homarus americanus]|uniref:uncharacterized protein LOC121860457 n=1 Tax=Homarus americanus TaxID=6706 RepID=UPI001C47B55C|nr:uncharacterized protein LOC121860457 [Homarus americanus]
MKVWVVLVLVLLTVLLAARGVAEKNEGRKVKNPKNEVGDGGGKEDVTVTGSGACKNGDNQPHLSLTARVQHAQVVFYGFVTRVYKKKGKQTYPAEFFIVNVFKGAELMARLLKVDGGYGGVYNLRDKRINVTNFGPREACLSPLEEQRTFIILATSKTGRRLRAHYDHPGGAAVQWTKENEEEVWRALGK